MLRKIFELTHGDFGALLFFFVPTEAGDLIAIGRFLREAKFSESERKASSDPEASEDCLVSRGPESVGLEVLDERRLHECFSRIASAELLRCISVLLITCEKKNAFVVCPPLSRDRYGMIRYFKFTPQTQSRSGRGKVAVHFKPVNCILVVSPPSN